MRSPAAFCVCRVSRGKTIAFERMIGHTERPIKVNFGIQKSKNQFILSSVWFVRAPFIGEKRLIISENPEFIRFKSGH